MKPYKIYLFDFDGTTFDTRESLVAVFRALLAAVDVHDVSEEDCAHYMHQSLQQTFEDNNVPQKKWQHGIDVCNEVINAPEVLAKNIPFPETRRVLQQLSDRGAVIGYVSGNTREHISKALEAQGFPFLHSVIMGSDIYEKPKPYPEPILMALKELGAEPGPDVIYVGDSLQDAVCAEAAGVDRVLIDRDGALENYPGRKIKSLEELL